MLSGKDFVAGPSLSRTPVRLDDRVRAIRKSPTRTSISNSPAPRAVLSPRRSPVARLAVREPRFTLRKSASTTAGSTGLQCSTTPGSSRSERSTTLTMTQDRLQRAPVIARTPPKPLPSHWIRCVSNPRPGTPHEAPTASGASGRPVAPSRRRKSHELAPLFEGRYARQDSKRRYNYNITWSRVVSNSIQ